MSSRRYEINLVHRMEEQISGGREGSHESRFCGEQFLSPTAGTQKV
mgnify:CR=1 FL=1